MMEIRLRSGDKAAVEYWEKHRGTPLEQIVLDLLVSMSASVSVALSG